MAQPKKVELAHKKRVVSLTFRLHAQLDYTRTTWYLLPHTIIIIVDMLYTVYMLTVIGTRYVTIRTNRRLDILTKNENRTRCCRETTRASPRPPSAESGETNKVRHVAQTPHRMVDLNSRARASTAQNHWS